MRNRSLSFSYIESNMVIIRKSVQTSTLCSYKLNKVCFSLINFKMYPLHHITFLYVEGMFISGYGKTTEKTLRFLSSSSLKLINIGFTKYLNYYW